MRTFSIFCGITLAAAVGVAAVQAGWQFLRTGRVEPHRLLETMAGTVAEFLGAAVASL
jgi:hypothetical protein